MYIGLSYEVCLVDIRLRQLFDIFVIFSVFDFDYLWRTSCWCRLYNSWHGAPLGHYFEVLFIVLILVVVVLFVYLFFNLWKTSFIYNCDVFLVALRCPCFWLSSLDFIQFPKKNQLSLQIYMYIYIFFWGCFYRFPTENIPWLSDKKWFLLVMPAMMCRNYILS